MTRWRMTEDLGRALAVSAVGLALAVVFGDPVLVVLVAPLALHGALALRHRPQTEPSLQVRLGHPVLHEGQGTTSVLALADAGAAEQVSRVVARTPYVALRPPRGALSALLPVDPTVPVAAIAVSPRRWGRLEVGAGLVALTSRWGGYRFGPVPTSSQPLTALPTRAPFDSRAAVPQPVGLVGAHRSRRVGAGTELAGIRPFVVGDRLRRIDWPVSLRTGELHTVETHAEQDAGVLLVVDALAELGRSEGIDGRASSLDVTVRAAAAVAEHHVRTGDRVALRVVGGTGAQVRFGAGQRHLRVLTGTLARVRAGTPPGLAHERAGPATEALSLRATAGTVVVVLSPMLHEVAAGAAAQLARRGLQVLVVDTLPPDLVPEVHAEGGSPWTPLAWRMRRCERELLLERLASTGCPVVPWRGPGTVDEVLRRLARRAQLPQVRLR